jgi:hypothetical protein
MVCEMKNKSNLIFGLENRNLLNTSADLGKAVQFSYLQSSALILGDYRGIKGVQEVFNQVIINQFTNSIYLFDELKSNNFAQSLLNIGYGLNEVKIRDFSESNIDYDLLTNLFQKNDRLVISVEDLPKRTRNQYWKMLSLSIRSFMLENRVPIMVWINRNLTFKEPDIFEEFRILGLWGEEFGLRFTLFYDQYASLSSPSRTLFGIIGLFPGLPDSEVNEILKSLSVDIVTRNHLYSMYRSLGMHQMLVVSPSDMFPPFLAEFI